MAGQREMGASPRISLRFHLLALGLHESTAKGLYIGHRGYPRIPGALTNKGSEWGKKEDDTDERKC